MTHTAMNTTGTTNKELTQILQLQAQETNRNNGQNKNESTNNSKRESETFYS